MNDNRWPAIEIRGLEKSFGAVKALDGLDLTVHAGEVRGFRGWNLAGKLGCAGGAACLLGR